MNSSINDLETGVLRIKYPTELRKAVEDAVQSWKQFCVVDEDIKASFPYFGEVGAGYELKKVVGATLDLKEDFHYTKAGISKLTEADAKLKNPAIHAFITSLERLSIPLRPLVLDLAQQMEQAFPLSQFSKEIAASEDAHWVIRFIHYFGGSEVGDEIAKAHADKSGFTLHLYESDPGLEYLDHSHVWQDLPVSTGETVIILGMRGQYRSKNKLKATYHRVVANAETAQKGRFSVVAFIHPKDTPAYNKAGAGRLQDFEPGFNYEMPFEEFSKLFL